MNFENAYIPFNGFSSLPTERECQSSARAQAKQRSEFDPKHHGSKPAAHDQHDEDGQAQVSATPAFNIQAISGVVLGFQGCRVFNALHAGAKHQSKETYSILVTAFVRGRVYKHLYIKCRTERLSSRMPLQQGYINRPSGSTLTV